ncbi:hypothetical protein VNO78_20537 [Psophocarpus tetragonolobus]|uniref:Uncharacterized protein n=1 Tax=Psophocarpus tetragonolobus TaxID=3891 RepID=A0AAN9XH85_PSOTE
MLVRRDRNQSRWGEGMKAKGGRVSAMGGLGVKEELTKGGYGGKILMLGIHTGLQLLLFLLLVEFVNRHLE